MEYRIPQECHKHEKKKSVPTQTYQVIKKCGKIKNCLRRGGEEKVSYENLDNDASLDNLDFTTFLIVKR